MIKSKWIEPLKATPTGINLALLAQTGSRAYGTNRPDSDYDYRGVFVEPLSSYGGLKEPKQSIDIDEPDITLYELKHFCNLAAKATPSILEILWCGQRQSSAPGDLLIANRHLFMSQKIALTFGGYAKAQLEKAKAGTGGSRGVNQFKRKKFKMHTMRLVDAGVSALATGILPVKVSNPEFLWSMADKPIEEIEYYVETKLKAMDSTLARTSLPVVPDYEAINDLMLRIRDEVK